MPINVTNPTQTVIIEVATVVGPKGDKGDPGNGTGASTPAPVQSVQGKIGAVVLTPADIGAADATHTHPIATATVDGLLSKTDKVKLDGLSNSPVINPVTTTVNGLMLSTDKTKLDGIAANATANATDAILKDRANHTGMQAISTVTGLQTALDTKYVKATTGIPKTDLDTATQTILNNTASPLVIATGMVATVAAFVVGGFTSVGGTITMPAAGTWYVGVEMSSGQLRVLPRLGHRGWVPVARIVCTATAITSVQQIAPVLPVCRIPRTMKKVLSGLPINVVVAGSSLTASGGDAQTWPGMVFGAGTTDKYKLPVAVNCQYTGVGGSPSGYQHAMMGFATTNSNYGFSNAGYSMALSMKSPPNGRSQLFNNCDVVVLGCLANGGDYRMELVEPMIRQLRKRNVEVILVTDNPQNPSLDFATMSTASLYSDGPELMRIADLYGCEIADTAAYVFESHFRANGVGVYSDAIHQAAGIPNGPATLSVANGHESWARAVRSTFPAQWQAATSTTTTSTWDFTSTNLNWYVYGANSTMALTGGKLVSTTTAAPAGAFCEQAGAVAIGDTITITYDNATTGITSMQMGGQGPLGWNTNVVGATMNGTATTVTLTVTQAYTKAVVLWYATAGTGTFSLDNVTMTVVRAGNPLVADTCPGRMGESKQVPPNRIVTDYRTPGDTYVTLPPDERHVIVNNAAMGTLVAHPWGAISFARRFSNSVSATQDLLSLAVGKKAIISGDCVVGMSIIHYREAVDGACTININVNGALNKTMTIPAPPFSNEWFFPIFTPTELNAISPAGASINSVEIEVVAGVLKIAALVASTADIEYVMPEQITFVGSGWGAKEASRSGLPGRWTDTPGDYAVTPCTGRRVLWVMSANPGSKMVSYISSQEQLVNQGVSGNYHIYANGGLLSPNSNHMAKCVELNATGTQTNGHALHIGGAIIINDR
jgi:hypothetical protein